MSATPNPLLTPIADDLWIASAPVHFLGMHLTSTMTVVRLPGDAVLVHSPVALTPQLQRAVESLGTVRHLYVPNTYHHLAMAQWAEAFPRARVHAPAALATKRRDVRIDRTHDASREPDFDGTLDEVHIDGFALRETVLHHKASATLVVADLVHNVGRPAHAWTSLYTRMAGFRDRVAISRVIRWTAFSDRAAARRSVESVLALPFERVVVGHGAPLEAPARDLLAAAYAWLLR